MRDWSQDRDVENNERRTLPERPQRSHWKFNYKYTTKLILLDSLLQEVEDFAPTLCFR
jgi:hypothetical protein